MGKPAELEKQFWMALRSDMTMMLGLVGVEESHTRPMTAQLRGSDGPIWFFTSRDNTLVQNLRNDSRAIGTFTSKNHELFASIHGRLSLDNDPEIIDEQWSSFVAAWYEGGKDDPDLALLRFDAERAEIWQNESGLFAGLKTLLGIDPRKDYRDKVAEVNLRNQSAWGRGAFEGHAKAASLRHPSSVCERSRHGRHDGARLHLHRHRRQADAALAVQGQADAGGQYGLRVRLYPPVRRP